MTVIFHTNAGAPVLAGDMLLSVPGPNAYTDLRLPSHPKGITFPSDTIPSFIPIRMRRKVFIVNDHLAIGTAGSALHISKFISDLCEEFGDKSIFSRAELTGYLDQCTNRNGGADTMEQVVAILLAECSDWRGSLTTGLAGKNITSQRFGRVITIGTGADSIIEQVTRFDTKYKFGMSQPPDGATQFPEFSTLALNLQLLANLYWKEFTSPANLFEAWGGAYDLIYQDSNRTFQYLNDYTIVLRLFNMDESDKGIQLMNVLKYERRPDISLIAMLNEGQLDFFGAKDITASDLPVSVTIGKDDFTMNSRAHISIIAVGKGNTYLSPLIQIDGLDPTEQARQTVFSDFDEEGRLRVFFHAEHDEWLRNQAISYFETQAHNWSPSL